jgi:hypothetical protein
MWSRKCRGHQGPASAVRLRCTGWSIISTQAPLHLKQISARNYSLIHWVVILLGLKTSTDNWKFLARGTYNTHSDYRISEEITNTRYNETDFKTAIGYSDSKSVLRYNYNNLI